jgi:hypothetical protein
MLGRVAEARSGYKSTRLGVRGVTRKRHHRGRPLILPPPCGKRFSLLGSSAGRFCPMGRLNRFRLDVAVRLTLSRRLSSSSFQRRVSYRLGFALKGPVKHRSWLDVADLAASRVDPNFTGLRDGVPLPPTRRAVACSWQAPSGHASDVVIPALKRRAKSLSPSGGCYVIRRNLLAASML